LRTPLGSSELSTEQTTKKATLSDFNFFALALLGKSVHPHELKDAQVEAKDVPVFFILGVIPPGQVRRLSPDTK